MQLRLSVIKIFISKSEVKKDYIGRVFILEDVSGADYMTNFSLVSLAEISARLPEQILLKRRLRLHEESFSPG